jgi:hypothetical protein
MFGVAVARSPQLPEPGLTNVESHFASHCGCAALGLLARLLCIPALLLLTSNAQAQSSDTTTQQFWFDYNPTFQLTKNWAFDAEAAFHIAPNVAEPWREFSFTPNIEYSHRKWIDFTGGLALTRTHQTDSFGSFETKPYVGVRLKWTTRWRGIRIINYARWEFRFQKDLDTDETSSDRRFRNRVQMLIPLNTRSLSEDNTFYLILDGEAFRTAGKDDVEERFKSRERYRAGLAWRRDSAWTFQFIYALQKSRNNIGVPFLEEDHILRFRFIHTIKK